MATLARAVLVLAFGVTLSSALGTVPAAAQGFGWFGNLFGGQRSAPPPRYPGYGQGQGFYDDRQPRRPPRRRQTDTARAPRDADTARAPRDKDRQPSKTASAFVYVFGDSLGQSLATGLDDALADRSDVAIVHMAKGSTGLVATDFYDWPKVIEDLVARQGNSRTKPEFGKPEPGKPEPGKPEPGKPEPGKPEPGKPEPGKPEPGKPEPGKPEPGKPEPGKPEPGKPEPGKPEPGKPEPGKPEPGKPEPGKPEASKLESGIDVAVMMIGSNDRQDLRENGKLIERGTPEWTAAYRKRVLAVDEAFLRKGIPLVWVGVPITRDDDFADDMAAFNEIYRDAAAKTGAVYVDSWEAFSDDDGNFSAVGPDINGQIVRLRTPDGVYFTKAGGRKLAHFVEAHVRRALDGKTLARPLGQPQVSLPPPTIGKPDVGPVSSLADPPVARDGKLASAVGAAQETSRDALVEATIVKGQVPAAPAGRADDLLWPAR